LSVNINYQGTVYGPDGNPIDCYYQAFTYNISKWSDLRQTEYQQYNVNFGDGDLNGQDGTVKEGDPLVVAFWVGSENRADELELFSVVVFVYDGTDSTVQDVQILQPHNPSCSFSIPSSSTVGEVVSATSGASTTYQWTFSGKVHYQRVTWYGQTIFGFLGIDEDLFDFGDGYNTDREHIYSNGGTFEVWHFVGSTYNGYNAECTKEISVYFREPTATISFSNDSPILGEEVTVENTITDPDSRISEIRYYFDDQLIHIGTELNYNYVIELNSMDTHYAKMVIYWNDYFEDRITTVERSLFMQNQAPTLELSVDTSEEENGRIIVNADAHDVDGVIDNMCWKLFYQAEQSGLPHPYFKCEDGNIGNFREIYQDCDRTMFSLDMIFAIPGTYKVEVEAFDDMGASVTQEVEIIVNNVCDGVLGECPECPEPPSDCIPIEECREAIMIGGGNSGCPIISVVKPDIDGTLNRTPIKTTVSWEIDGEIGSGIVSGSIQGNIKGKIN